MIRVTTNFREVYLIEIKVNQSINQSICQYVIRNYLPAHVHIPLKYKYAGEN